MPAFGGASSGFERVDRGSVEVSQSTLDTAAGRQSNERGTFSTLAGAAVFAVPDLIDSVAASTGVTERRQITNSALAMFDSPGLNDYYADVEGAAEVASGVLGIVGAELITNRLTKPAGLFMRTASKVPYVRRIAALDRQYELAVKTVADVDLAVARQGLLGGKQYTSLVNAPIARYDAATGGFKTVDTMLSHNQAARRARGLGVAKGARHVATTEAVLALTMNENGFLFEDDMAHNLAWMGAGLLGGAVFDSMYTSYRLRKIANSDLVRREFANALDPETLERGRTSWLGRKVDADSATQTFLGGVYTDRITSLLVGAKSIDDAPFTNAELQSTRKAAATEQRNQAFDELQKVTSKGIWTDGRTRVSMNTGGIGNHLRMTAYRDAGAFNGVEMIGGVPDDSSFIKITESHDARVRELIEEKEDELAENAFKRPEDREAALAELVRLQHIERLTPTALVDGETMPITEAESFVGFIEPEIRKAGDDLWEIRDENAANRLTIDKNLNLHQPSGKTLDTADHYEVMRAYRLAQRAIQTMKNSVDPVVIPSNPTWFQLDMAEEILRQSNNRANIQWPDGMTRESAQVESFMQKAEAIKKQRMGDIAKRRKAEESGKDWDGQLSRMRLRYNLPRLTSYERGLTGETAHPVEALLRGAGEYGVKDLRGMSRTELQDAVAKYRKIGGFVDAASESDRSLQGRSFMFGMDESGQPIKPILMYKRPINNEIDWNVDTLAERMAIHKQTMVQTLVGSQAPLSASLTRSLMDNPDFDQAARTHEILETQLQGNVVGGAPDSFTGAVGNALVTSEWRDRDAPTLLAASRVRDQVDRLSRAMMKTVVDEAFGDSLSLLKNPRNAKSQLLLNQFHSFRSGWDLKAKPVVREDGMVAFALAKTPANAERFKAQFGRDMADGQTLVNSDGKEIVLDQLGLKIQESFNQVGSRLIEEKNTLLRAMGRGQINSQPWYTPPPNTRGKLIGFTLGPDKKPVPGYSVVAESQQEFDRARAEVIKKAESELGMGYVFHTQDEIANFADLWDRVAMEFVNPHYTAVQPGKSAKGRLVGPGLNVNAFDESLTYLRDGFLQHGNDILSQLMRDSIQSAKLRAGLSKATSKNQAGIVGRAQYRNAYDYYLENLLGKSKLNAEGSIVGSVANPIEGFLNRGLEAATPALRGTKQLVMRGVEGFVNAMPWVDSEARKADFNTLSKQLGDHMPFKSAMEMAERKSAAKTPVDVQRITGELNKFTAAMVLRMFETAHPILNMAGMVNAMPSVIRNLRRLKGESEVDWAERIGHNSNVFDVKGEKVAIPDMGKIATRAFKRAWSRESHEDYAYMVKRGYLSQEVAEFQRQFGAIDSKGAWERFFYGDSSQKSRIFKGKESKGVVGWTGILSDKSEDFSRSWGHMVGLELADVLRIQGRDARHNFAHDMANKMIANYNPLNRPEIFQGAMGAPIGLFQSFVFNYYQRLFRYVETKDYQAAATQYAVQAGLFGVTGLTGWDQLSGLLSDATKGEEDIDAGIYSRLGEGAGNLIAGGVLSNIPAIFGGEAVDFYSRGDTNVRLPGLGGNSVPAYNVLQKVYAGIQEGLAMFKDSHPGITGAQLAEVASNMMANRPIAGMIEQMGAGGLDTDQYGQVVADTQSAAETVYRMLGVRSMRQSKEIEAFYGDKNAQEYQDSAKAILRKGTRAAIRAGRVDMLPSIFERYVDSGGDPRFFRRWMKENFEAATTPKTQRKLEDLLNNPANMGRVVHMLDRGVGIGEDEELPETESLYYSGDPLDPLNQDTDQLGEYPGQTTVP